MFKSKIKKTREIIADVTKTRKVAIDIGLYSIKCAYLENNLLCMYEYPLFDQPKDIRGQDLQELTEHQMNAVKRAMIMIGRDSEIILSPPPSLHVLTRVLNKPAKIDQLEFLVEFLEKELPFEPDQFTFDIQEVKDAPVEKKSKKGDKKTSKIAVAATDLEFVNHSIGLLGEFQRQVKKFTPDSVALLNFILLSEDRMDGQPVVLLDMGATYSSLIVFKEKEKFLVRPIELGGNHFNLELVDKLNVDYETAEKIKFERALIDDSIFTPEGASKSSAMFQTIDSVLYRLVDELKNTMTYFEDYFMDNLFNAKIVLTGGASKLKNLDRFLRKEIGLPVNLANGCSYDMAENHEFSPEFASTVGLLGKLSHPGLFEINLLNNIDGMLFKLKEGDYYLTKDGFIDKKRYKKKAKTKKSAMPTPRESTVVDAPAPTVIALIKELQDRVKSLIKGEKVDMRVSFREVDKTSIKNQFKNIFVVLGALFMVFLGVHQFYWAFETKRVNGAIKKYLVNRAELNRLSVTQPLDDGKPEIILKTKIDKILWTNKLKAIAASLPEKVWISNMEIKGSTEEFEGIHVARRSLVITCHVMSHGQDHLQDIAQFIRNISKQKIFLKDFTGIKFHSATRNQVETDMVDFSLTFPLARNILVDVEETLTITGKTPGSDKTGLERLMDSPMIKDIVDGTQDRLKQIDSQRQ